LRHAAATGGWSHDWSPPSPSRYQEWHGERETQVVEHAQEGREVISCDQTGIDGLVSGLQ
jgi:hypothetical protein